MTESLRDRQKALARNAIIEALADEIAEHGVAELSLQAVADRAGVSIRTLYNYFENRETLIQALLDRFEAAGRSLSPLTVPDDFAQVPAAARIFHAAWQEQGNIARAGFQLEAARIAAGGARVRRDRDPNSDTITMRLLELHPDLDPDLAAATALILRTTVSGRTWFRLTAEHGVPAAAATDAAVWAWRVLVDAVLAGDLPEAVLPGAEPDSRVTG